MISTNTPAPIPYRRLGQPDPVADRVVELLLGFGELDRHRIGPAYREEIRDLPLLRSGEDVRERVELLQVPLHEHAVLHADRPRSTAASRSDSASTEAEVPVKPRPAPKLAG